MFDSWLVITLGSLLFKFEIIYDKSHKNNWSNLSTILPMLQFYILINVSNIKYRFKFKKNVFRNCSG